MRGRLRTAPFSWLDARLVVRQKAPKDRSRWRRHGEAALPGDSPGPVTLIGLIETIEGTAANCFQECKYNIHMSINGIPELAALPFRRFLLLTRL
jgi:hypothetical protein